MTFAFNGLTLPFRTDFRIAGTQCHVSTNSRDILRAASRWPGMNYGSEHTFKLEIIVDPAFDTGTEHPAYFRGLHHLVFAFLPPRSFVTYDLLRRHVRAVVSTAAARDETYWNALLLPITIGVMGTTMGIAPLHCACLDRAGGGLLVAGISGAGKSTLAAALAKRGFPLVSDDWTYVSRDQSGLVAHGLCAPLKLLPDTVRFFPELHEVAPRMTLNGEPAYVIETGRSLGYAVKETSRPRWVLFLERTQNTGCHFIPCRSGYVREFFEGSAERLPDGLIEAKVLRSTIIQELSSCPAWILRTGESPQRTAEAIDRFLSEAKHATA